MKRNQAPYVLLFLGAAATAYYFMTIKRANPANIGNANMAAFLATIRHSEGTDQYPDPWGTYYGGAQFSDKSDHPVLTGAELPVQTPWGITTAAGAYQITLTTWEALGGKLHYGDFSDASQDQAAMDLIEGRGATQDILNGNFTSAVSKLGGEWASLPSSTAGQPTRNFTELAAFFQNSGGTMTA